jgi:sec-independent protein translocase protein TatA
MIVHIRAELIRVPLFYFEVCGMCFLTFSEFVLLGREMLIISSRPVKRQQRGGKVICGLFGLGLPELVVIAGVAAFLFGPKNLPDLGRSLGKTVRSFSQAAKEFESEMKSSANEFQAEVAGTSRETTAGESPNVEPPVTSSSSRNPSSTTEKGSG